MYKENAYPTKLKLHKMSDQILQVKGWALQQYKSNSKH